MALSVGGEREEITLAKKRVRLPPSISRVSICLPSVPPPRAVKGWPFNFFLRLIKLTRYARSTGLISESVAAVTPRTITNFPPRKEDPPTRTPSLREISCRPISRESFDLTYLLSDDCHRANSPVNSSPSP